MKFVLDQGVSFCYFTLRKLHRYISELLNGHHFIVTGKIRGSGVEPHDTEKSGIALKLVWLERGHPRASAVADVLSAAGFPDFGKQLTLLAKQSAETMSREGT